MAPRKKTTVETDCGPVGPGSTVRICQTRQHDPLSPALSTHDGACAFFREKKIGAADRESFYALHLDVKHRVVGYEEVSKGGVASVEVNPREVFKGAILSNASALLVAHNHPSGNPTPSTEDINLTKRLVDAGKLMGIPILDHVIVTENDCKSMRDMVMFGDATKPTGRPRKRRGTMPK